MSIRLILFALLLGGNGAFTVILLHWLMSLFVLLSLTKRALKWVLIIRPADHTANSFWFMHSQKRLGKTSLPNVKKLFAEQNYNILSEIMILLLLLWYSIKKNYSTRCSYSAVCIGEEIYISGLELQRWSIEFVIFFF